MSSPNFNNVTVVGCLLCYVEVFLAAYSNSTSATQDPWLCYVRHICRILNNDYKIILQNKGLLLLLLLDWALQITSFASFL